MKFDIWKECPKVPLPSVLLTVVDNRGKTVPTAPSGHKLIATNCVRNENLYPVYEKIRYLSEETYRTWFRAHPEPGDIIFVCKGTPGRVCLVPDPIDFCIAQDMVALRADPKIVYNKYLLAVLRSFQIQEQILSTSVGDVIPHFKKSFFDQIMIPIPNMDIQKSIGDFYYTISEKTELNKKINDNLYAQVKAIFSKNFLDLDFLPDGWKTGNLLDIADYLNGLAMQKYRPKDGETGLPVLKIKELRQGICDASSELCSPSIKSEYIIHDGDIIFSWSGSLLVDIWCGGNCGLNQHLFKVTSNNYDKWFYYLWTAHHLDRFIAVAADKATTMGHIKREELEKVEVIIPSKCDYKRIGALIKPLFDLIISNRIENRKLTALRNTLLPKIMAGEIDVSDIQL
ncbi:restriction endonuclease subunit S [Faecalibacterium sp.]|uniref:restriction endonuclease subunit S n=1 Tax=Faecalibacterium sp. TaxID=1971605 RepID=UPI003526F47E